MYILHVSAKRICSQVTTSRGRKDWHEVFASGFMGTISENVCATEHWSPGLWAPDRSSSLGYVDLCAFRRATLWLGTGLFPTAAGNVM
jgi:hypothetical protein